MSSHLDPVAPVILWVTLIFFCGVMGRFIATRCNQPSVLGELLMGVLVGNVCYFSGLQLAVVLREGSALFSIMGDLLSGLSLPQAVHAVIPDAYNADKIITALSGNHGTELVKVAYVVDIFSRYGVMFLLFMVGLESSITELKHTGRQSIQVAFIGVFAPMALGLLVTYYLLPNASFQADLFVAATLSATSIGITARVLKDLQQLHSREAKTILGAAMIDDILGLIILAIVSSIVIKGVVDLFEISQVIAQAAMFFFASIMIGPFVLRKMVRLLKPLQSWEIKLFTAFLFLMSLAWLASMVQLATIIGAFVAGLIIHDGFFGLDKPKDKQALTIQNLVAPLEAILAPLFFMLIGIQVKIETFLDWHVLITASGLLLAAIVGKLLSGLGAKRGDDRLLIGIGMLPRGEVGLVFASIGRVLGVISDQLFSAIILMIIVTTFIAPVWLKSRYETTKS